MSRSRGFVAAACAVIALPLIGSSSAHGQGIAVRQASWPDSLVTVADLSRACSRLVEIPALEKLERENLAGASALVAEVAQRDAATIARAQDDERLAQARLESATRQREDWDKIGTPRLDSLKLFCMLRGSPATWTDYALPSRQVIKQAATFRITYQTEGQNLSAAAALTGFLGIDERYIVGGIAKFLVDRASAEIQLAFVDRLRDTACDALRRPIFESTCNALGQAEVVLHASLMRELRAAAEQDLRRLPRSTPLAVITRPAFAEELGRPGLGADMNRRQDYILTVYLLGTVLEQLADGAEPLEALSAALNRDRGVLAGSNGVSLFVAALSRNAETVSLPVSAGLHRLALVSRMLPDTNVDGRPEWPATREAREDFIKTVAVNAHAWLPELGITTTSRRDNAVAAAATLAKQVEETRERATTIRKRLATLDADDTTALPDIAVLVDDGLALAEGWAAVIEGLQPRDSAIVHTIRELRVVAKGITQREYAQASVGLYALANRSGALGFAIPEGTTQAVSFISASAQAESSDEFAKTLESFAAPVRSYRTKRASKGIYFVVNGYLGAGGGSENANGGRSRYIGVAAPVGLEFGWGNRGKDQWSIGLMGQLIDVGTLASYRLEASEEDLESEPDVGFAQVFSPGGYVVLGIPHVPLTLGFGGNVAPRLRKVSETNERRNASRLGFILGVDIPIFVIK